MSVNSKTDIILLHGAAGSSRQFDDLVKALTFEFNVYTYNLFAHGGRETGTTDLTIELFSNELIDFIIENKISQPVNVFGYSMGGYVALYAAYKQPSFFRRIFTIATKFNWNNEIALKEASMLNPDKILSKVPHFASYLKQLHQPADWTVLLRSISKMIIEIGEHPPLNAVTLSQVKSQVLITVGAADKMVSVEESKWASALIPNAVFLQFDSVEHPIEKIPVKILESEIIRFLS